MFTKKIALGLMLLSAACFTTANAQSAKKKSKAKDKNEGIQKDGFTITKVHVDDPLELNNLLINFNPFIADVTLTNVSYKMGLDANYRMGKTFSVSMNANRALYDIGAKEARDLNEKEEEVLNTVTNSSQVEVSGTFFFANSEKKVDVPHYVHSESDGRITTNYYVKFPTTRLLLHGVKLGYNHYTSIAGNGMFNIDYKGKDISVADAPVSYFSYDSNAPIASMVSSNIISIGYASEWLCNIEFDVKGYGTSGQSTSMSFFGDILYAPSITISDYTEKIQIDYNNNKMVTYNLNDYTDKRSLGFRLGAKYVKYGKLNSNYGFEMGVRPGVGSMASGTYLMFTAGFGLGIGAK